MKTRGSLVADVDLPTIVDVGASGLRLNHGSRVRVEDEAIATQHDLVADRRQRLGPVSENGRPLIEPAQLLTHLDLIKSNARRPERMYDITSYILRYALTFEKLGVKNRRV